MAKSKILIGLPTDNGTCRIEIATYLARVCSQVERDNEIKHLIEEVFYVPIQKFPTSTARNSLVKMAFDLEADYIHMVDADANPNFEYFKTAFLFLVNHAGPAVIAAPYCSGGGDEELVQAFSFQRKISGVPQAHFALEHISRDEAARLTTTERVANCGTHQIFYAVAAYARISQPYYAYQFKDKDHLSVSETEDCWCHRKMMEAGIPLYCTFGHWSGHVKPRCINRPVPLNINAIPELYMHEARAWALHQQKYPPEAVANPDGKAIASPDESVTPLPIAPAVDVRDKRWAITDEEVGIVEEVRRQRAAFAEQQKAAPRNPSGQPMEIFDQVAAQAVKVNGEGEHVVAT